MTLAHLAVPIVYLPLLLVAERPDIGEESYEAARYVDVTITSVGYSPPVVRARTGDVVRFVQEHALAHNIEFYDAPEGARFAGEYEAPQGDIEVLQSTSPVARVGPMLIGMGRVYEIRIGEGMPPGEYVFGCSHHRGWRGTLVVEGSEPRS